MNWVRLYRTDFSGAVVRASAFKLWDRVFNSQREHTMLMRKEQASVLSKVGPCLPAIRFPPKVDVRRVGVEIYHLNDTFGRSVHRDG